MTRHIFSMLVAALAATGCGAADSTVPVTPSDRYIVETANGSAPPVILTTWNTGGTAAGDTGTVYLTGDTLTVSADGHYRESAWIEGRSGNVLWGRQRWSDHGIWTQSGDALHFESEYIENIAFDATAPAAGQLQTARDLRGQGEGIAQYVFRHR